MRFCDKLYLVKKLLEEGKYDLYKLRWLYA